MFCGHPEEVDQGRADKGGSRSIAPGEPLMWPQKMLLRGKSGTSLSASFSSSSSPLTSSPASFLSSCSHSVEVNINCPLKPFIRTMAVWCQQQDWALSHCSSAMMPCFLLSQSWRSCCQNHKIYLTQLIMNVFVQMCRQENQLLPHCLIIPLFNEEYIKEPSVHAWVPGCQTMSGVCLEVFILHNLSRFIVLTEVWRRRCWFTVQGLLFKVDWRWIGKNCGENSDPIEFTSTSSCWMEEYHWVESFRHFLKNCTIP